MSRSRRVSPVLRAALRPRTARCYRHCRAPVRAWGLTTPLPGDWQVYACPGGVVSVTSYVERSDDDPTERVRSFLRRHTRPAPLVTRHDLRLATRHGPELGRRAERLLVRAPPPRTLKVVYWRVYPFRGRDQRERRVFVCLRHGRSRPVFYVDLASEPRGRCPVCAARFASRRPGSR